MVTQSLLTEAARIMGSKGGTTTLRKYGPDFYAKIGKQGGTAVKEKHGPGYFSALGAKSAQSKREQREGAVRH